MSCPTCDHTMQKLSEIDPIRFWCPRCGTLTEINGWGEATRRQDEAPKLVARCREFASTTTLARPLGATRHRRIS